MKAFDSRVLVLAASALGFPASSRADVPFLRGDINVDGTVSIADTAAFGCLLFCAIGQFDMPCFDAADTDDDGQINFTDWVKLLDTVFSGRERISEPFPAVGPDPTEDQVPCERYEPAFPSVSDDVVELGHITALPGGRVSIPLRIQSAEPVSKFQIVLRYDPTAFTPVAPQGDRGVRDEFLAGTPFDSQGGSIGFPNGYLCLFAFPAEGMLRLGFDPTLIDPVPIDAAAQPVHVLNIVGDVAEGVEAGRVLELAFAEQAAPFGPVRTELVPETEVSAPARLPGTARPGSITVEAPVPFVRGDSNLDGEINISDAIHMLGFLFLGTADLVCRDAADVDDDGQNDLADSIGLFNFLFAGGGPPAPPWPSCGIDGGVDAVDCEGFPACGLPRRG